MPTHHDLDLYLKEYIAVAGISQGRCSKCCALLHTRPIEQQQLPQESGAGKTVTGSAEPISELSDRHPPQTPAPLRSSPAASTGKGSKTCQIDQASTGYPEFSGDLEMAQI
jgi:hypothetical protein